MGPPQRRERRAAASSITSSPLQNAKRTSERARSGSPQNTEVGTATTPARSGSSRQNVTLSS
jgi:hypothetical protein